MKKLRMTLIFMLLWLSLRNKPLYLDALVGGMQKMSMHSHTPDLDANYYKATIVNALIFYIRPYTMKTFILVGHNALLLHYMYDHQ